MVYSCCGSGNMSEIYAKKISFIQPDLLKLKLQDPLLNISIIDCRRNKDAFLAEESYKACHIPGAHYLNIN